MRFLFLTLLTFAFFATACTPKNIKDNTPETQNQEQETAVSQAEETQTLEEKTEPATFKEAVVKFLSPSPSKKEREAAAAAKTTKSTKETEDNSAAKNTVNTTETTVKKATEEASQEQAEEQKEQLPQYPELLAENDPEAIIIRTDDGRLTSPFYTAKEASPEQIAALKKPFWFGETLKYSIGWSFLVAGTAELKTNRIVEKDGVLAYEVRADAHSHSVIDAVFKVRDINASWLDVSLTKSLGYWQSVREGRYKRDEWLILDYKNHLYNNHKQDKHGVVKTQKLAFEGEEVLDMLSSLYFVRSQPLPENGVVYFDIVNRKKQYPLKVIVHGKKKVKVEAGEFNCILVEPQFSGEGIFTAKGKSLKVWLTDDEYKMPVKMAVEVFIGSVTAELKEYTRSAQNNSTAK